MKKIISLLLVILFVFSGCSFVRGNIKDPVEFYYLRPCSRPDEQKAYFTEGAFASEVREASGRRQDLYYLISMYLRGPLRSDLVSPFPAGCTVVNVQQEDTALTVYLNAAAADLEDMDLTLACACLAQTCMALTDVSTVIIESRGVDNKILFSNTITGSSLLLEETSPPSTESVEETQ